jgi:hypothetical protein
VKLIRFKRENDNNRASLLFMTRKIELNSCNGLQMNFPFSVRYSRFNMLAEGKLNALTTQTLRTQISNQAGLLGGEIPMYPAATALVAGGFTSGSRPG